MKIVGILAIQGDFCKHEKTIQSLGYKTINVKTPEDLNKIDAIILPGGESTTIGKLLVRFNIMDPLKEKIKQGLPTLGTCAGLILLSKKVFNKDKVSDQPVLGVLDIETERNAYGRQIDSFEANIDFENTNYQAVFIRAPKIISTSKNVEILASYDNSPILIKQGNIIGASFHPELTENNHIHRIFTGLIK